jgi:hypothetical protein
MNTYKKYFKISEQRQLNYTRIPQKFRHGPVVALQLFVISLLPNRCGAAENCPSTPAGILVCPVYEFISQQLRVIS